MYDRRRLLNQSEYGQFQVPLNRTQRAHYWKGQVALRQAEIKLHEELGLPVGHLRHLLKQAEQRYFYNRHQVSSIAA